MNALTELSILIPEYNYDCTPLVRALRKQVEALPRGVRAEIVVADDASTEPPGLLTRERLAACDGVRLLALPHNVGRARIRNLLAREAAYGQLLYLDCDVALVRPDFLCRYMEEPEAAVLCGGVTLRPDADLSARNLRYRYEQNCLPKFTLARRRAAPYQGFRTTNFRVRREVMSQYPFDASLCRYGYEDVLWGRVLREAGVEIVHTDNPIAIADFEDNARFLDKTEEGLHTLCALERELRGYSRVISCADRAARWGVAGLSARLFDLCREGLRRRLSGSRPSVRLYQLYRLGFYLGLRVAHPDACRPAGHAARTPSAD